MTWRWIDSETLGAAENMAVDEALLRAGALRPTLRTYAWRAPGGLSLGYFQAADRSRVEELAAPGFEIVRRPTGGGAICHADELTYSLVWPLGEPDFPRTTLDAYELVHGVIARALGRLGVDVRFRRHSPLRSDSDAPGDEIWCFYHSVPFDLVLDDRKLVGSAQRRTGRGFLVHGSVPLAENPLTPRAAFAPVPRAELAGKLGDELARALGRPVRPAHPDAGERRVAAELVATRYGKEAWTWRRTASPSAP